MGQRRLHMSDLSEDAQVYKNWWGWGDDLFFKLCVCVCQSFWGTNVSSEDVTRIVKLEF